MRLAWASIHHGHAGSPLRFFGATLGAYTPSVRFWKVGFSVMRQAPTSCPKSRATAAPAPRAKRSGGNAIVGFHPALHVMVPAPMHPISVQTLIPHG